MAMNKAIKRAFFLLVALFLAVIVNLTWIMVVRADWFADRPENRRELVKELRIKRGTLTAYDGSMIAGVRQRSGHYERTYPGESLAPHLVGYSTLRYGHSGIEAALNDVLIGEAKNLGLQSWVDRLLGRPQKGASVKLTIVPAVQRAAQRSLVGAKGAVVVLSPKTGALIASASAPTYSLARVDADWRSLNTDKGAPLLNRATQGLYAPGSAFKVVTAASGLDAGLVTPSTTFTDTGKYGVYGGQVTNHAGSVYGTHDLTRALTLSINTTFAKIGTMVEQRRLTATMQKFGFFAKPSLTLPSGELAASGRYGQKGLLPTDDVMDPLQVAWMACGQEKLLTTPLQMALVASGVANGGRVMKPYCVQQITSASGKVVQKAEPTQLSVALQPKTASELTGMMQRVVEAGTGTAAALRGVSVAGKTGTAERGDGTNLAWFIAFAPAENPVVAVAVVLEDTHATGGELAAPVAASVIKTALAQRSLP